MIGAGTIGVFAAQWAKLLGAKSVTAFDMNADRLALAKSLGADHVIDTAKGEVKDKADEITSGRGFDFVYEVSGAAEAVKSAFNIVGNRGSVCLIGTPTKDLTFTAREFETLNRKEFRLTGSWMSYSSPFPGKEWAMTAEYLSAGRLKIPDSLVFKRYGFKDAGKAFALFKTPAAVKGKVLFVC